MVSIRASNCNSNFKVLPLSVVILWLFASYVSGYSSMGCFSSLPSSFTLKNTYEYQTSSYCSGQCSGYAYFALSQHDQCYCGNDEPTSSTSSSSCNAYCYGYSSDMCGGDSAYSVFSVSGVISGSSSGASASGSTSSSASSGSSSSQSASSSQPTTSSSSSSKSSSSTSSSSAPSSTTSSTTSSEQSSSSSSVSVVYATSMNTESGTVVYVTNTITQSASATASSSASSGTSSNKNSSSGQSKKANIGAIVGGVVGGVGGALVVAAIVLLLIRHRNKKREQDRMEKEYQEAIKPVEYGDKPVHGGSPSLSINGPSSGSFDDDQRNISANNPFDDSRRISNGSILNANTPGNQKILTVVNPDED